MFAAGLELHPCATSLTRRAGPTQGGPGAASRCFASSARARRRGPLRRLCFVPIGSRAKCVPRPPNPAPAQSRSACREGWGQPQRRSWGGMVRRRGAPRSPGQAFAPRQGVVLAVTRGSRSRRAMASPWHNACNVCLRRATGERLWIEQKDLGRGGGMERAGLGAMRREVWRT